MKQLFINLSALFFALLGLAYELALERGRILPDAYTIAADGSVWEVR